jgi:uncharacterized protein involved in exopolysaccharide biosynthesis
LSDTAPVPTDLRERLAQIDRAQEETRRFTEEQHKLIAERHKLDAEEMKLRAEETRLLAERSKTVRDTFIAPWQIVVTAMETGAALLAAGAAFFQAAGTLTRPL